MATRTPEELVERLRAALVAHDEKLGKTYCGCQEHRALRQAVIDAARELLKGRHELETAEAERDRLQEALSDLWTWATEARRRAYSDPVPDGLGARVIAALSGADHEQNAANTIIQGIPGTSIRANSDGTFDRIWPDGQMERASMKRADSGQERKR